MEDNGSTKRKADHIEELVSVVDSVGGCGKQFEHSLVSSDGTDSQKDCLLPNALLQMFGVDTQSVAVHVVHH